MPLSSMIILLLSWYTILEPFREKSKWIEPATESSMPQCATMQVKRDVESGEVWICRGALRRASPRVATRVASEGHNRWCTAMHPDGEAERHSGRSLRRPGTCQLFRTKYLEKAIRLR